ncbi:MAG: CYTH domain-containing protein [Candidatus Obscuribacter phosphatis]|uniref:CYTH domain-containing protein n=1 Tax=Candidatus Obscuribacter phosphatis TaxID=1906157 RepID=A0A8J7PNE5_9BACT|nr:CYTH domain-containing protein [Candidatus Obscuribacter phosphatis]
MSIVWQALVRMLTEQRPSRSQPVVSNHGKDSTVFEVERKFRLKDGEAPLVATRLKAMGFAPVEAIEMTDVFLPTKVPGEMLRVRSEKSELRNCTVVTIKEWVQLGQGRERQETEEAISAISKWFLLKFGQFISGRPLLSFSKTRLMHETDGKGVVIAVDNVQGLLENSGYYVEIEVLVPRGGDVEGARAKISALASELFGDEREFVQASYQDMLKLAQSRSNS